MSTNNKPIFIRLAITFAVLVLAGVALMTFVPKLSIWSCTYSDDTARYDSLTPGQSVSVEFDPPCEVINGIEVDIKGVSSGGDPIGVIDVDLVLESCGGTPLFNGHIRSLYEESFTTGGLSTNGQGPLTLTFTFNSAEAGIENILVGVTDDGHLAYTVRGINSGAPTKSMFLTIYILFSVLVLVFAYYTMQNDPKTSALIERLLFAMGVIFSLIFVNQLYDLFMTAKCGLNLIDSIKQGRLLDYYDIAYTKELDSGNSSMFFGYNYNIFIALPAAVLMLPFSFFVDDIYYNVFGEFVTLYMKAAVALMVVWSIKLTQKVGESCEMPAEYNRSVKIVYAFSPLMLYISILFGQIDIMYVILMLIALPFYYKGRYRMFSLIMAFSVVMKLIPFMAFIPLILLVNKKIRDIALNTLICISVKLGTLLLFEKGIGYSAIMNLMSDWHGFINKLIADKVGGHSLFIIAFAAICIYCYMKDIDSGDKKNLLYHSMLVIFAVYASFAAFVDWHPQWLIPLVLSFSFLIPMCSRKFEGMLLFSLLEVLMILGGEGKLNTIYMIQNGLLASGYYYDGISISGVLTNISAVIPALIDSLIVVAAGAVICIFVKHSNNGSGEYMVDRRLPVGRILVLYTLLVGSFWCYTFVG